MSCNCYVAATQIVARGLDPRVHLLRDKVFFRKRMDCRVKPGNDSLRPEYGMRFSSMLFVALAVIGSILPASGEDSLKLAVGQRGNWATSVAEVGQRAGIFKKHGLALELLYTQGSGETQQAVIAESVDIGIAPGTMGVMSAFAKGAPVRILGAETTGASDIYWYVKADSPIKTIQDFDGRTIAYSTVGASTHMVVMAFIKQFNLRSARAVATGSPFPTLTQVMSGQIDIGWAAAPDGLDQLDRGDIRIVATGNDVVGFRNQTVRVNITNADTLARRRDTVERFVKAYRETVRWLYSGDDSLKIFAEWLGISLAKAKRTRDEFYPWQALDPDKMVGLDAIARDAVTLKYLSTPLTQAQLDELVVKFPQ
jgi:NitT/TauT family transport system substrate-binding protein